MLQGKQKSAITVPAGFQGSHSNLIFPCACAFESGASVIALRASIVGRACAAAHPPCQCVHEEQRPFFSFFLFFAFKEILRVRERERERAQVLLGYEDEGSTTSGCR
jgi:hypothetical protein